ncbi:MAG: VOC family protein [Chloroflexota bacterium]
MLGDADLVALVAATDLERARAFYEGALGLKVVGGDDYGCVFDANGTSLRVSLVQELTPAPYTVLGWTVADIRATARELASLGVAFQRYDGMGQDQDEVWTAPGGAKVAWFRDPDGNTLSLTEPASR